MKQKSILEQLMTYCETLESAKLKQYLLMSLSGLALLAFLSLYKIQQTGHRFIGKIRTGRVFARNATNLVNRKKSIEEQDSAFSQICKEKPLKKGLVQFITNLCQKLEISPKVEWQETFEKRAIPNTNKFEEHRVRLNFHGQTTEQLVTLTEELLKEPAITLREIDVKREGSLLTLNMLIASRAQKPGTEA